MRSPPTLEPCSIDGLSPLRIEFARATWARPGDVLVMSIAGTASNQGPGSPFQHASAMCLAAMEAWQPSAVVFDLRECRYDWGDQMASVISAPNRWDRDTHELLTVFGETPEEIEVAVVASEGNREPLRSDARTGPECAVGRPRVGGPSRAGYT